MTGSRDADRLLKALERAGAAGLRREEIGDRVFAKHGGAARIDEALAPLLELELVVEKSVPTGGRPGTVYVHTDLTGKARKAG